MMNEIGIAILVLGLTGFVFSLVLAFLSKYLKVEENPQVEKVIEVLPGLNCGACGFSGCKPFAEAVVKECNLFSGCLPGGQEVNTKVSEVIGAECALPKKAKAVVCSCQATGPQEKKSSFVYQGPLCCRAAQLIGGTFDCRYSCIALGDCIKVCPTEALALLDQRIIVDRKKCIACGKCIKVCPRNLFAYVPFKEKTSLWYVACSNKEKALGVRGVCSRGCIACGICARVPDSTYVLKDNLSRVDYGKAANQQMHSEAATKCPTKCILRIDD